MATYELVIEQRQPTCGGRLPTKCEIRTVAIDDPVAYVRAIEKDGRLETYTDESGAFVVRAERGGLWIKYEFTEE